MGETKSRLYKKETAKKTLAAFMDRVMRVNGCVANLPYPDRITDVIVFGSYLDDTVEKVHDLDICINVEKHNDLYAAFNEDYYDGKAGNYTEALFFPYIAMLKYLKSKNSILSIHPYEEDKDVALGGKHVFLIKDGVLQKNAITTDMDLKQYGATRTFYRVEFVKFTDNVPEPRGGYVSAAISMAAFRLGINPLDPEFEDRLSTTDDPETQRLMALLAELCSIKIPDEYKSAGDNERYCLYNEETFAEELPSLMDMADIITETSDDFALMFIEMDVPDSEILYEDGAQIVITKDTYDKCNDRRYLFLECYLNPPEYDVLDDDYDDEDDMD